MNILQRILGSTKWAVYRVINSRAFMGRQQTLNVLKEVYRATEYLYLYIRSQKLVVKFLGYGYQLSDSMIELDITFGVICRVPIVIVQWVWGRLKLI